MSGDNGDYVVIYTDGGCDPNPGVGGWGAVLLFGDHRKELSGGERNSTNNRMELTAALEALTTLTRRCQVEVHTDSEYLKKGITEWLPGWKRNGWRRKRGAIKNLDLWQALDEVSAKHDIEWRWVPGHAGVPENERCDDLASEAIRRIKRGED